MLRELHRNVIIGFCGAIMLASPLLADTTVINFDNVPGFVTPFPIGTPVPDQFIVNDEYLSQGILFGSSGSGVWIATGSNPVSPPNVAAPTGPGSVFSFTDPSEMSFWVGPDMGVVDAVSITLTNTSSFTTFMAFDMAGNNLGSISGNSSVPLTLQFPGSIHRAVLTGGPYAFDDVVFSGLAPSAPTLTIMAGACVLVRRRRH